MAGTNSGQVIAAQGVSHVDGRELFVEVFVWVPEGADADGIARQAIADHGASAFESASYTTTGLVWSQFSDAAHDNDFVVQFYNGNNDPLSGAGLAALTAAQQTWNAVSTSDFAFSLGDPDDPADGMTNRQPSLVRESRGPQVTDGFNDVAWMPLSGGSTLGVTWYDIAAQEADVALNTKFNWSTTGGNFDAETVFLHELGHVLGLGHSTVSGSIMEAVYAGVRRELHPDDISGISTLYPAESMPTGDSPVVSITGPADGSTLESGATIAFAGAASDTEDGDLSANLVWVSSIDGTIGAGGSFATVLSDGMHVITATVTDSDGNTTEQSISITVGDVDVATSVSIASVTYSTEGGRNNNRHLSVTLTLTDNLGQPVSAATVGVVIYLNGNPTWQAVGTTDSDGRVTFTVKNAPNGTYYTGVYQIAGTSLSWDGTTPFNNYEKSSALSGGRHGQHRALGKQARPETD